MRRKNHFKRLISAIWRQGWYLPLLCLTMLIPPYASRGYRREEWGLVNAEILTHPIKGFDPNIYPLFQVIPLILLAAVFAIGKKVTRLFAIYVALTYILTAFLQNISAANKYGFGISLGNVVLFLILAGLWLREAISPRNEFQTRSKSTWRYLPILPALLAMWMPVNPVTLGPDFNPLYLFTSGAGLSFCLATPLFLAILIPHYPQVNKAAFVATAFIGLVMSLGNFALEFYIYPSLWWIGVLHLPLFINSACCLALWFSDIVQQVRAVDGANT
ncbi:MAG: hypothetical protein AB9891_05770 [Anaerolineaceae bacterium]